MNWDLVSQRSYEKSGTYSIVEDQKYTIQRVKGKYNKVDYIFLNQILDFTEIHVITMTLKIKDIK